MEEADQGRFILLRTWHVGTD